MIAQLAVRQGHSINGTITLFTKLGDEFPVVEFPDLEFECTSEPADCGDPGCPSDSTNDGQVDAADLADLLSCWGSVGSSVCSCIDTDNNGLIDAADLADLLADWGLCF